MTDPVLRFAGAALGYGEEPVLADVDLDVHAGSFVGLLGPNGAGKSTMLKAVYGEAEVHSGRLEISGRSVASMTPRQRARVAAVVPQTLPLAFAFTGREFVAMGRHAWLEGLAPLSEEDEDVVAEAMRATDTLRLAGQRVDTLSGGDLQRLTLAQALAQQPGLLLLDEPTSHLDLNHRLQVLDLVGALAEEGIAVLAVFHDLDLAARYADVLAMVAEGGLLAAGAPEEVLDAGVVSRVFGVRSVIGRDPVTSSVTVTPVVREEAAGRRRRERVFLAGGSGAAAPLMRLLELGGYRVSVGAVNEGDVDADVAKALGLSRVVLPPFEPVPEDAEEDVGRMAREADVRIVAPAPFGRGNLTNLSAAVAAGPPLLFVRGWSEERDFAGGAADELAQGALAAGASVVADERAALEEVERLLGGA